MHLYNKRTWREHGSMDDELMQLCTSVSDASASSKHRALWVQQGNRLLFDRTHPVRAWQEGNNLDDALLPGSSPRIKSSAALAKPPSAPPPAEQC